MPFLQRKNQEMIVPAFEILLELPDTEMSSAARGKKTMLCAIWHKDFFFFFLPLETSRVRAPSIQFPEAKMSIIWFCFKVAYAFS